MTNAVKNLTWMVCVVGLAVTVAGCTNTEQEQAAVSLVSATGERHVNLDGSWNVVRLVGRDGQSALPPAYQGKVQLTFTKGKFSSTTGCNDVDGTYRQSGNGEELVFPNGDLRTTLVGCDEPPLVMRLLDVRSVSDSGSSVVLLDANQDTVAELRRS